MPSTITHAYMANDIYNGLDINIKKKFSNYLDDYKSYSQGPDIFFFYKIFLPFGKFLHIQKFGSDIHRKKVNELFISITKEVKRTKNINQFIYLCGLYTHYLGDTTCHPFVNYTDYNINKNLKRKKDYHFIVELYMDNYVLYKKNHDYKKFKGYKFALSCKKNKDVEEMLNKSFLEVFNEKNIGTIYYKSLKEMNLFFHILRYDPYKIKRCIYNFLYIFAWYLRRDFRFLSYNFNINNEYNNKYLNLNHKQWFNIKKRDNTSIKSFPELYDEVVEKGIKKIKILYDYIYNDKNINLEDFYGNLSYANGLPIKQ